MSKIALSGNANGSGTFTIASPNSNSDRILNLPDSAGTLATAESTLTQFNASGSAPVYAARAWVNFNGTGTVAIRASGNVSSITDNGTGDYTVNFTTAMSDANYSIAFATAGDSVYGSFGVFLFQQAAPTSNGFRLSARTDGGTYADSVQVNCAVFR
jgi:hypothetical protein